jgi:hypothetical protein
MVQRPSSKAESHIADKNKMTRSLIFFFIKARQFTLF